MIGTAGTTFSMVVTKDRGEAAVAVASTFLPLAVLTPLTCKTLTTFSKTSSEAKIPSPTFSTTMMTFSEEVSEGWVATHSEIRFSNSKRRKVLEFQSREIHLEALPLEE